MNKKLININSTVNLAALVLISSFLQHNHIVQYALLSVALLIMLIVVAVLAKGLASKKLTWSDLIFKIVREEDDYVSLGVWLLVTSLAFYSGHQKAGYVGLGILILLVFLAVANLFIPRVKSE
jgi:cobalamin synthase